MHYYAWTDNPPEEAAPKVTTRLCAAAPDLLAALKLCLPIMAEEYILYGPNEPETRAVRAVRAAIAAAEGETT